MLLEEKTGKLHNFFIPHAAIKRPPLMRGIGWLTMMLLLLLLRGPW
jgi:hypothetical protein